MRCARRVLSVAIVVVIASRCPAAVHADEDKEPVFAGKPLREWIDALYDADETIRAATRAQLSKANDEEVAVLIKLLEDDRGIVRAHAAGVLAGIGQGARAALPALIAALKADEEVLVRVYAARALGDIGPAAKIAGLALVRTLKDEDPRLRKESALALGLIGADARTTVGPLTSLLKDKVADVRTAAAVALACVGRDARTALSALLPLLKPVVLWLFRTESVRSHPRGFEGQGRRSEALCGRYPGSLERRRGRAAVRVRRLAGF